MSKRKNKLTPTKSFTHVSIPIVNQMHRSSVLNAFEDDRTMYSLACTPGKTLHVNKPRVYATSVPSEVIGGPEVVVGDALVDVLFIKSP